MSKKKSKLQLAQEQAELTIKQTNDKINELGDHAGAIYTELTNIQGLFDAIRNVPNDKKLHYEEIKRVQLGWKQQVDKIEADYNIAVAKNAAKGIAGVGAGVTVVALGPTAAMGVATTFGVASTGTAISTLSGAAATNAALAWLGGGAVWAGGGGMVAGKALLALAGPIGWAIAAVSLVSSGLLFWKATSEKQRFDDIFASIAERDIKSYELAIVELNERILRLKEETGMLRRAIELVKTFGTNYHQMTEEQQYTLGSFLNLMSSSTQLLVNPILGLQANYNAEDLRRFVVAKRRFGINKDVTIFLANLLYKIDLDEKDKQLIWKSLRKNKKMLETMNLKKSNFDFSLIETTCEALAFQNSAT